MKRISLTDESKMWFDAENASVIKNDYRFDGSNHISLSTNSQFYHECIYITKSHKIIKHAYSNYQGSKESYFEITLEDLAAFLIQNEYFDLLDDESKDYNLTKEQVNELLTLLKNAEL